MVNTNRNYKENRKIVSNLLNWYSGDIHDCLDELGIWGVLRDFKLFGKLPVEDKLCGPAVTVRFVPTKEKIMSHLYHQAIDEMPCGSIMVVDTKEANGSCTGELMCAGIKRSGGIGAVVNGTIRDINEIEQLDFPIYAKGVFPVSAIGRMKDVDYNIKLEIDKVIIKPGDFIFLDKDGVVVIPKEVSSTIVEMANNLGRLERTYKERIANGEKLSDIFSREKES